MSANLLEIYRARVESGALRADPAQQRAVEALHLLAIRLERDAKSSGGWFSSLARRQPTLLTGLYLFGGVGRGKTMLMDLFFNAVATPSKQRTHFHVFMRSVHDRIAEARKTMPGDPIPAVGEQIVADGRLLCFDEFQVTDIADAMILGRLFDAMFAAGAIVVATSNAAPRDLYRDGLNRDLFLPFIATLDKRMDLIELNSPVDFRMEQLAAIPRYFSPLGREATAALRAAWVRLNGCDAGEPDVLTVKGRAVELRETHHQSAFFTFADLFQQPLGANDYLAISERFHTVFLDGVPKMTPAMRNEARRFVTFIDALYDAGVKLLIAADGEPHELYPAGDEAFAFERAASRLVEMRGDAYVRTRLRRDGDVNTSAMA